MLTMKLERKACGPDGTVGELHIPDKLWACITLEDTDRRLEDGGVKVPCQTAIPRGRYEIKLTWSPHFNAPMPLVCNVPGYVGVRIHCGNTPDDTDGCILVGESSNGFALQNSRSAFAQLMELLTPVFANNEQVFLEIS